MTSLLFSSLLFSVLSHNWKGIVMGLDRARGVSNNWFFSFGWKSFKKRERQVHRLKRIRRLRSQTLESRRLLAADIDAFRHNELVPEDVNGDGQVTSVDALTIINAMNRREIRDLESFTDVSRDGQRTVADAMRVINRLNRDRGRPDSSRPDSDGGVSSDEVRSIDGTGNNLADPELGSAGEQLTRVADDDYADGISDPAGEDRPSAREISNVLSDDGTDDNRNERDLTAFLYVWGQFLDHDIDLTESQDDGGESFAVDVPLGDESFDPFSTGESVIPLKRSQFDGETGTSIDNPREQVTSVTSFIDGSMVYGSDQETADGLRSFVDGKLLISENGLLPTDEDGDVLAGDIRAAENLSLTAMQALFVREHNRIATEIAEANPELTDEDIYQEARATVIGEIQSITFNEFLPALLGERAIDRYQGYDSSVDPSIANEFSTAAFRFGHSTLNDDIEFFDNDGRAVRDELELADAFFNPSLLNETGIDAILKYDASSLSQEIDLEVVDGLRNFLFGPPGAGGLDLVALNIQRGRDHGLSDYNATREAYGLDAVDSFTGITSDVELQGKLESLYGDVNNIDLWVGLLAEDHVDGASVGELTGTIIADQFERLRDGDRFWYEGTFQGRDLRELQGTTLADVIQRNTNVEGLQGNVFFFTSEISGQVTAAPVANADPIDRQNSRSRRGGSDRVQREAVGVENVTVELLDDAGDVVDATVTDARGNYRFTSFAETGDYQVRLADTGETLDLLVSTGDLQLSGIDFVISQV